MAKDPQVELHKQWLGYLQPQGLVVAPTALVDSHAILDTNPIDAQNRLRDLLIDAPVTETETRKVVPSIHKLCVDLLGWRTTDLIDGTESGIETTLPEYHETLRPDFAVKHPPPAPDSAQPWLLLVRVLPHGTDPDKDAQLDDDRNWRTSHQARFERLLRESQIPIGLLFNGTHLRLIYAPKGESSGTLTFPIAALAEVSGRPILAALLLLLDHNRLFTASRGQTLPDLLEKSRKYQNKVSTELAQQVLAALHELLRGFQGAHAKSGELLLKDWLRDKPEDVYGGLLTVILRLIFLLYAEDRGLLGNDEAWHDGYSVLGLYERLRSDSDRFPDTMDQRRGAWAQLLAVFRLVFDGAKHGKLQLPPRHGYLFHPDGGEDVHYQFLEGRPFGEARQVDAVITLPLISDGVVWRVLSNLMVLDGERISYRTLNVEQIGSVYETMMGFQFETTKGPSLAIKPAKPHGAPAVINLLELLAEPPGKRGAWLKESADCKLTGRADELLKAAARPEDVPLALGKKVSPLTPTILAAGSFVLQPSDARRKSGSHYTPPQLTQPIVQTTLRPILEQLGPNPKPEQLLELKVCDPAMGSGAFLVEACRQLGAELVKAWHHHRCLPKLPPDEDELLYAKRLVATRCLYGVDKNPFAVALAKLSLWLETFAKEHAFTFVDHALRCGDSLVGLGREQIAAFHWDVSKRGAFVETVLKKKLKEVEAIRAKIHAADEGTREGVLRRWLREADEAVGDLRLIGDLVVAAFFGGATAKEREVNRGELAGKVEAWLRSGGGGTREKEELRREVAELRAGVKGVPPFHWEIEFPEVFTRGGFDAFVGNPPFLNGTRISSVTSRRYVDWLIGTFSSAGDRTDLVAYFFRKCFSALAPTGALGLLATSSIAKGDTRTAGLSAICLQGGHITYARKRQVWPGQAAVIVSSVVIAKTRGTALCDLDGKPVQRISAYLFHQGGDSAPQVLSSNRGLCFSGPKVDGAGFTFDDDSSEATPICVLTDLRRTTPNLSEVVSPLLGGREFLESPTQAHRRYVIDFGDRTESEAQRYPALFSIISQKVRTQRTTGRLHDYPWWQFERKGRALQEAKVGQSRLLMHAFTSAHMAFAFVSPEVVVPTPHVVMTLPGTAAFACLQGRIHEEWIRLVGSSMSDSLRYAPSDCFETFPFPEHFSSDPRLEAAGKSYYEFRADLMVRNDEGLTKTYNRFHDPDDRSADILKLRELHAAMDRAVLDAYGWTDLQPTHEFLLDYEAEDDDEEDTGRTRRRKKPWRYRWPDDFRDEVLARLLRLNEERADEEKRQTPPPTPSPAKKAKKKPSGGKVNPTPSLFGKDDER